MSRSAATLDLWPIGNCQVSALVDTRGHFVWGCVPRVDGDPVFSALMRGEDGETHGSWAIDLDGCQRISQGYLRNTPVLRTEMVDDHGNSLSLIHI